MPATSSPCLFTLGTFPLAPVNPLFVLTFIPAEVEHGEVGEQVQRGRHAAQQVAGHVQHRQQREQQPRLQGAAAVLLGQTTVRVQVSWQEENGLTSNDKSSYIEDNDLFLGYAVVSPISRPK